MCRAGKLGLITEGPLESREMTLWAGIHISTELAGQPWVSVDPKVLTYTDTIEQDTVQWDWVNECANATS